MSAPNICGKEWLKHPISAEDTMTRLALKYDTSIGQLCRANRMHWQDVLQTRRHIWVPVRRHQPQIESPHADFQECQQIASRNVTPRTSTPNGHPSIPLARSVTLPPHFYRQSAPNPDLLAEERDPLLITTKIMWAS
ncbi:uncharacterized protein LOC108042993 [Drosophila rhopaloa]|uniref:Uncharacterized protein LOC108042993 n=1 Tax=Drosophila rhopaloa TaxID=1041015 RepID=A0A6P4EFP1_DRORH|nr:uncharacterized protein LOC108042993 [Drosophila rhopaloa]